MVEGDGERPDVGGGVWESGEGIEDGQVVGSGGNRDVSVEGALCDGVEDEVCACDGDEICGGEVAADGVQELWREGERGHGARICRRAGSFIYRDWRLAAGKGRKASIR